MKRWSCTRCRVSSLMMGTAVKGISRSLRWLARRSLLVPVSHGTGVHGEHTHDCIKTPSFGSVLQSHLRSKDFQGSEIFSLTK